MQTMAALQRDAASQDAVCRPADLAVMELSGDHNLLWNVFRILVGN